MATEAVDAICVDTNVLVYATIAESPFHNEARSALRDVAAAGATLWISRQILRELVAVLTRPQVFPSPVPLATVVVTVEQLEQSMSVADETAEVTRRLVGLLWQRTAFNNRDVR